MPGVADITDLSDDEVKPAPSHSQASSKNAAGPVTPGKNKAAATPEAPRKKSKADANLSKPKPAEDDATEMSEKDDAATDGQDQDQGELAEPFSEAPPPSLPAAKPKSKPSKAKAKATAKAKGTAKAALKRPSASSPAVMKRPASSQGDGSLRYWPDGRIRVQKGLYKNGVHGLKMGGRQVCLATQQQ